MSTDLNLLQQIAHRPWELPIGKWSFYQEWNDALFLHWKVDPTILEAFIPEHMELDLFDGHAWISVVAFTMEGCRPRNIGAWKELSDFHEINIRTYVKLNPWKGVHFLSIEAEKQLACVLAQGLSGLPYRYSSMKRSPGIFSSANQRYDDRFYAKYETGNEIKNKSELDLWLTERYALIQGRTDHCDCFQVHHPEWPLYSVNLKELKVQYLRFSAILHGPPDLAHYSPGVQVLTWGKDKLSEHLHTQG